MTFNFIRFLILGDLQDEGVLMILRLVDLTLKIGPPQSSRIFQPLILRSMQVRLRLILMKVRSGVYKKAGRI